VNDNSTDQTKTIILNNCSKIPFETELIDTEFSRGKTNALNYAFPRITTEITVATDADSYLDPRSIRELVKNFYDQRVGGVNGIVKILSSESSEQTAQSESLYRWFYNLWRKGESDIHSISICNGPIIAFRTLLLKDVKIQSMADDTELVFEIIRKGKRVVYDDTAIAYECTPPRLLEQLSQKMRRCKGIFQVYFWNLS
jgi:biofilm PGA synthesis N-glycosyltransferase PgaC